ncbi:MAG: ATP-binding protein [Chloroflexi bacterium]|nr:ATP-binding protein [Chloroflexota bacterium]
MGETRVNLQHLLEDIRDTYPFPVEEAIVTELVANALDSNASEIRFVVNAREKSMTTIDNGHGMTPPQLEKYHDIAATTKTRGKGIGFAGIGAKLALLIAKEVITETKSGRSYNATRWRLENSQRAPWELIEPAGILENAPRGTAVTLVFGSASTLLEPNYVELILQSHFQPLLDDAFREMFKSLYHADIHFFINKRAIKALEHTELRERKTIIVRAPQSTSAKGKPVGVGFIAQSEDDLPELQRGIGISAYGKVIKMGWDWTGLTPKHPTRLSGLVEVPALVEILTTNKADFLKDSNSLKKYYRYRKAIQNAVEPILHAMGESAPTRERSARDVRPLEREVERVLGNLVGDYPEIAPLVGRRRTSQPGINLAPDKDGDALGVLTETLAEIAQQQVNSDAGDQATPTAPPRTQVEAVLEPSESGNGEPARTQEGKRVGPGLMIGFEDASERAELGWLLENTVWVNRGHPAYQKAVAGGHEQYHVVLTIAWVLLGHLNDQHSAQRFIGEFLFGWGARR